MGGMFNAQMFNDEMFNTTAQISTAHGVWEGPLQRPQIIKPWKNIIEETHLELLIISEPTMGQLFKTDLSSLPYLKQYKDQLYDILLKPIKGTFNEFKLQFNAVKNIPYNIILQGDFYIKHNFGKFIITSDIYKDQMFKKILYGEKLHGIHIINMIKEMKEWQ